MKDLFKKYKILILLAVISIIGVALFFYRFNQSPPCLNADEVSFSYDAYSILKTGRDQYGNFMPLRFKSFGDFKLPLLTYLSVPFIEIFGLNIYGVRLVNFPFIIIFPFIIYLLAKEFFDSEIIALLSSFLINFAPGIITLSRQEHEGFTTLFFITLATLFFVKLVKKERLKYYLGFFTFLIIALFSYHSSRIWAGFFILASAFFVYKKKLSKLGFIALFSLVLLFSVTDVIYYPTRLKSLLFTSNPGFADKTGEFQGEGGSRLIYNKLTVASKDLVYEYIKYFSPQFMVTTGDQNVRFGYPGMSPITPVEYVFIFIGIYYLFKNKEKWRFLLIAIFLFAPLSASLSWAEASVTRSVFIFVPTLLISSYGIINLSKNKKIVFALIAFVYLYFAFYSWDLYLNHYPKRAYVVRAWQCGYKELMDYVKDNYNRFDKFYITRRNGQPYIFFLYYLKYSPQKYQSQAQLSSPDKFGFGQVDGFDKFEFNSPTGKVKNSVIIGYPEEFDQSERASLKQIKIIGTETIFLIKEVK